MCVCACVCVCVCTCATLCPYTPLNTDACIPFTTFWFSLSLYRCGVAWHDQFQDDGARNARYQPWYANTGFFYMRSTFVARDFWDRVTQQMPSYPQSNQVVLNWVMEGFESRGHPVSQEELAVRILPQDEYVSGNGVDLPGYVWGYCNSNACMYGHCVCARAHVCVCVCACLKVLLPILLEPGCER